MASACVQIVAAMLALAAMGCSLTGLDRFQFPTCPQTQCDVLNARDGIDPAAECFAWRCDDATGLCRFRALDADGDRVLATVCAGGSDCDDFDPDAFPGAAEVCDGSDDDCDGMIDEAYGAPLEPAVVLDMVEPPAWVRAIGAPEGGVAIAYDAPGSLGGFDIVTAIPPMPRAAGAPLRAARPVNLGVDVFDASSAAELAITSGCPGASLMRPRTMCASDEDCSGITPNCEMYDDGRSYCEAPVLGTSDPGECTTHADCDDEWFCNGAPLCEPTGLPPAVDERGCRTMPNAACSANQKCDEDRDGCVTYQAGMCGIEQMAIAPFGDDEWLGAFVTAQGCDRGQLRLGYFGSRPERTPDTRYAYRQVLIRGDDRRSTSWLGVDVDVDGGPCTGHGRAVGAPFGATGVVAAALPRNVSAGRRRPQALVAYLAGPQCREADSCAMEVPGARGGLDVEVIGAWLEEATTGSADAPIAFVNASGNGMPARLGVTTNEGAHRPALASFDTGARAGYALAYPAPSGIAVHVIDALPDPSPECTGSDAAACLETREPYRTRFPADTIRPDGTMLERRTDPLEVPAATTLFSEASATGDAVMALGAIGDGSAVEVGFAWIEADAVAIAHARLDAGARSWSPVGSITRFAAPGVRHVSIAYVEAGLRRTEPGQPGGDGFVIVWSTSSGTYAARTDASGQVLQPGAVALGPASDHAHAFLETSTDDSGRTIRTVRVLAHRGNAFVAFPAVCGAAP